MTIHGKCHCSAVKWQIVSKVNFTAACHCTDCQTISGSGYGSTSLFVYDPNGVKFSGEDPKIYRGSSEEGSDSQRGFCGTCGTVLFSHVAEGQQDEHWAVRTGSMLDSRALRMEKEVFMKSKLSWIPIVTKPEGHYIGMPKARNIAGDSDQQSIEEVAKKSSDRKQSNEDQRKIHGTRSQNIPDKRKAAATADERAQRTIEETTQTTIGTSSNKVAREHG